MPEIPRPSGSGTGQSQTVLRKAIREPMDEATCWVIRIMAMFGFGFILVWQGKVHIFGAHQEAHSWAELLLEIAPFAGGLLLCAALAAKPEAMVVMFIMALQSPLKLLKRFMDK